MSIEHKAFAFDHDRFTAGLGPILYRALETGDISMLSVFVDEHRASLRHPDLLEPIDEQWRQQVQPLDAHQVGDLALTAYYDPGQDIGLAGDWDEIGLDLARAVDAHVDPFIGGEPFGPPGNPFDPGKLGSYFRSWATVRAQRARLAEVRASDLWSATVAE